MFLSSTLLLVLLDPFLKEHGCFVVVVVVRDPNDCPPVVCERSIVHSWCIARPWRRFFQCDSYYSRVVLQADLHYGGTQQCSFYTHTHNININNNNNNKQ